MVEWISSWTWKLHLRGSKQLEANILLNSLVFPISYSVLPFSLKQVKRRLCILFVLYLILGGVIIKWFETDKAEQNKTVFEEEKRRDVAGNHLVGRGGT